MDPLQGTQPPVNTDYKGMLMDMVQKTRGKVAEANTARIASKNQSEVRRSAALREVFTTMQQAGVDLTDPQSVAAFIQKLKDANPEVATYFEEALEQLLSDSATGEGTPNDENISKDVRGRDEPQPGAFTG